jgi:hypothetical protein
MARQARIFHIFIWMNPSSGHNALLCGKQEEILQSFLQLFEQYRGMLYSHAIRLLGMVNTQRML